MFGDLSCNIEGRYEMEFNLYELDKYRFRTQSSAVVHANH